MKIPKCSHLRMAGAVVLLALLASCASVPNCPPCNPKIETKEVYYPSPVLIRIQLLPLLDLPTVPPIAPVDATDEEKKANAIAIGKAREEREAILLKRDEAWQMKVREHNSQEVNPPDPPNR